MIRLSEDTYTGLCLQDGHRYEWQWVTKPTKTTGNDRGTTGWGIPVSSSNPNVVVGQRHRFHLCTHNPCQANWKLSQNGLIGAPTHCQQVHAPPLAPVVEPADSQLPSPPISELSLT